MDQKKEIEEIKHFIAGVMLIFLVVVFWHNFSGDNVDKQVSESTLKDWAYIQAVHEVENQVLISDDAKWSTFDHTVKKNGNRYEVTGWYEKNYRCPWVVIFEYNGENYRDLTSWEVIDYMIESGWCGS